MKYVTKDIAFFFPKDYSELKDLRETTTNSLVSSFLHKIKREIYRTNHPLPAFQENTKSGHHH